VASTAVAFGAFASTFCFAVASVADFVFSAEEACAAGLEEVLPAATALEAFVSASASCVALSSALLLPELFVWMETFSLEGFDAFSLSFGFAVASTAVAFGAFASTFCFAVASVAFVFSEEEADAAGLEEALTVSTVLEGFAWLSASGFTVSLAGVLPELFVGLDASSCEVIGASSSASAASVFSDEEFGAASSTFRSGSWPCCLSAVSTVLEAVASLSSSTFCVAVASAAFVFSEEEACVSGMEALTSGFASLASAGVVDALSSTAEFAVVEEDALSMFETFSEIMESAVC